MKTNTISKMMLLLLVTITYQANCQYSSYLTRGHSTDDIYVIYDGGTYIYLLYLTSNGEVISKRSDDVLYSIDLTAEPVPGKIIGHNSGWFGESDDYGHHFYMLPPFPVNYIAIDGLYGGESPGNYAIQGFDASVLPFPMGVLYKTTDNFATYTLVADTLNELTHCEGGFIAGELYHIPVI
ncbi:MAG TPA: hypothetical protein PLP88_11655, partial [Bacteroidales bacterium]|nr:hypothetical protein [Bacteroidales bacterium]